MATPRKGKAKVKVTSSGKKVSYGQAGKAKGGGPRVKPGTSKGDSSQFRSSANALPLTKSNITTHALKNLEATRNAKRVIVFNVCSTQAR